MTIRSAAPADEEFLFRLFAAEKAAEFAPLGLDAQQLRPLLEMQYRARHFAYAQEFPAAVNMILCLADGTQAGRHLVERQQACYRTIDIAVLPEHRNRGIATWALRQMQQVAALEAVPFRLRVMKGSPALRLYERIGFIKSSADELSYEMEWQPPISAQAAEKASAPAAVETAYALEFDRVESIERILAFIREIGLEVNLGAVPSTSFLPGIQTVRNGLRVNLDALKYPGDLLHEAGHLAVMTPDERNCEFPDAREMGAEMAAQAWSYAAALHIGIAPELVFHDAGYKGHAAALLDGYRRGGQTGVPLLAWFGLTTIERPGTPSIYPQMLRWLRETTPEQQEVEDVARTVGSDETAEAGARK